MKSKPKFQATVSAPSRNVLLRLQPSKLIGLRLCLHSPVSYWCWSNLTCWFLKFGTPLELDGST